MELAVLNLTMNARDSMPDGGLITISARHMSGTQEYSTTSDEIGYICLAVTDWGDGMDEATLHRATDPFFTTKGVGKGTGLGLSMVHGFAEQSNGHFFLKSQPGKGTTAELWLPMVFDHARCATPMKPKEPYNGPPSNLEHGGPQVVLAVDDDRLALMNTAAMLNDLGYRVYSATSGKQALSIIRKEVVPDLVIVDHSMPDMNGLELVEAIRNDWPDLRIIFATPLADATVQMVPKPSLHKHLASIAREAQTTNRIL